MRQSTQLITLGTAAGPAIRGSENGIASAVVVGDSFYVVDFGLGCVRAAHDAGLRGRDWRAGFITHLHSDHVAELPAFMMYNWGAPVDGFTKPVRLLGPGPDLQHPRGAQLAGTRGLVEGVLQAYSYDLEIRSTDEARPELSKLIVPLEIPLGATENTYQSADDDVQSGIVKVYEDDLVRVSATLVDHRPVRPAYAFRFDTDAGSITFSGDTAECAAVARLAAETDILVHEAVNLDYYAERKFSPAFLQHQAQSHTSPEGAGRIAAEAGARHLVLSHLAGIATPEQWHRRATSTYDGMLSVAASGDRFELTGAAATTLASS